MPGLHQLLQNRPLRSLTPIGHLQRMGSFAITVDPVEAPIWSVLFLTIGVVLLSRSQKQHPPSECNRLWVLKKSVIGMN
jgi:hypothetical protein